MPLGKSSYLPVKATRNSNKRFVGRSSSSNKDLEHYIKSLIFYSGPFAPLNNITLANTTE